MRRVPSAGAWSSCAARATRPYRCSTPGGKYVGTVNEGDFLRLLVSVGSTDPKDYELKQIKDIVRHDFCPPLGIDADEADVITAIMSQNFVPIVDVRGILCGILTRRAVIAYLAEKAGVETEPEEKSVSF